MIRRWAWPIVLVGLCACRIQLQRPSPAGLREEAAWAAAGARPGSQQAGFRDGFMNGARMVEEAVQSGRRLYLPQLASRPLAPALRSALSSDVSASPETEYVVEMDEDTGLIKAPASEGPAGFKEGQVQGFQWAFETHRAKLARPRPQPAYPDEWHPWSPTEPALQLLGRGRDVDLVWAPGLLAWAVRERGFAPRRWWRSLLGEVRPTHAALVGDALWLDTGREALALDLETGAVRRVAPAPVHAQEREEVEVPVRAPLTRAEREALETDPQRSLPE